MSLILRDKYLEEQIAQIQAARHDATPTKTMRDLLREYLTQLRVSGESVIEDERQEKASAAA